MAVDVKSVVIGVVAVAAFVLVAWKLNTQGPPALPDQSKPGATAEMDAAAANLYEQQNDFRRRYAENPDVDKPQEGYAVIEPAKSR